MESHSQEEVHLSLDEVTKSDFSRRHNSLTTAQMFQPEKTQDLIISNYEGDNLTEKSPHDECGITNNVKSAARKQRVKQCGRFCETMTITATILLVVSLFSIPTIVYALSQSSTQLGTSTYDYEDNVCLDGTAPYSGEVCKTELISAQTCYSDQLSPLTIPSGIDQQQKEDDMTNLAFGLDFLDPSEECEQRIWPLLCLHTFGLCDSNGDYHGALRKECLELRDKVCVEEWQTAADFLPAGTLPECERLQDLTDTAECDTVLPDDLSTTSNSLDHSSTVSMSTIDQNSSSEAINCSIFFFFDQNDTGLCRPICGAPYRRKRYDLVLERIGISVGFASSIFMFILAFVIQRDTLLIFPPILLIYLSTDTFFLAGVIMAGFFDNQGLFCSSEDLIYANGKGNSTVFCAISGITFNYTVVQVGTWIALHAVFLFWGIAFPFNYRRLKLMNRFKYAHILSIVVGVVFPLPAALLPLKDGYVLPTRNVIRACAVRNADVLFYTFILPLSFLLGLTTILLALMFGIIFKNAVLKKLLSRKKVGKAGKAEIKISFILIYYVVIGVLGLVTLTYLEAESAISELANFFICEGLHLANCSKHLDINAFEELSIVIIVMLSLLPVVALIFSCNIQTIKKKIKECIK